MKDLHSSQTSMDSEIDGPPTLVDATVIDGSAQPHHGPESSRVPLSIVTGKSMLWSMSSGGESDEKL